MKGHLQTSLMQRCRTVERVYPALWKRNALGTLNPVSSVILGNEPRGITSSLPVDIKLIEFQKEEEADDLYWSWSCRGLHSLPCAGGRSSRWCSSWSGNKDDVRVMIFFNLLLPFIALISCFNEVFTYKWMTELSLHSDTSHIIFLCLSALYEHFYKLAECLISAIHSDVRYVLQ